MKTLNTTRTTITPNKYYTFYENTILLSLNFDGYNIEEPKNDLDAIQETYKIFMSEYGYPSNIVRYGNKINLFAEYLRGLPSVCTVPFMNSEILENAKKVFSNKTLFKNTKKEDAFLSSYWLNLAKAFFALKENL